MTSKRLYQLIVFGLCLFVLLAAASVYYGRQLLLAKSNDLTELNVKTEALNQQERSLIQAKEEIEEYAALETVATSIVPQEKDQARTIREIVAIAADSGVKISSISFPSSELGNEKAKTTDQSQTQLTKVDGIPGLFQLELNVALDEEIDYQTLIGFLRNLEQNRRTSAISSIIINPVATEGSSDFLFQLSLTVQVYIKP